ncbi:MAG: DUF4136 domain-containing protein [Deltaproteobacteria bacterium]|jgi:hypothetical protein|nr:DUF4136 domain-containing protein [Deltaproteobacteria bacterium]MBW2505045.1 DUF4136 domain-containing protein [Deltaproteobacteria bacterium]
MKFNLVCSGFLVLMLCSCLPSQSETKPLPAAGGVVVSVKNADLNFAKGTSFSFAETASQFYQDPRLDDRNLNGILRDAIDQVMRQKGYRMVDSNGQFEIAYVVALAQSLSDVEINQRFGISPGMVDDNPDPEIYEKGSIVVDIADPAGHTSLWRSALQGYAHLELPDAVRRERLQIAMQRLFASLPAGL